MSRYLVSKGVAGLQAATRVLEASGGVGHDELDFGVCKQRLS